MMRHDTLVFHTLSTLAGVRSGMDQDRCRLVFDVLCTSDVIHAAIQRQLAPRGINELRFNMLLVLLAIDPDPVNPADLAYQTGVTRAAITDALDDLARQGLVTRTPDTRDRRMVEVRLTEKGHRLIAEVMKDYLHLLSKVTLDTEVMERRPFLAMLRKLQEGTTAFLATNPSAPVIPESD